ncbi:MAG: glycosyltransferase, partial [Clostridia bacterium]|nr:glycosyltransferase [Clostridia bacterium]
MDLISVIVPVYKTEKYLDRCVNSIVNQTYKNLEIILVDDGSPDRCPELCDRWAEKDNRIKVIHQENGGMSAARNAGLRIAKGDYIGFVDSDDWIDNDMYEYLYILLINNQADYSTINYDIKKRETDRTENQNECINLLDNNRMFEIFFRVITSDIRY